MKAVFEKPVIETLDSDLLAFFTVRNELQRLPYFFEYYRKQGVTLFFVIDNNSDDGTTEFLKDQPDVEYFHTENSYVSSKAGRFWTTELADFYGIDRWCLTLDVDELLVFPGSEKITVSELTQYMDERGFEALFTIFLDMYSDKPLREAVYTSGKPFLETCQYFEKDTYKFHLPQNFPPLQIFGGPRQTQFWDHGGKGKGPSMRKIPLVKWRKEIKYFHSTHSITPLRMADFTGALLHFKFFASFEELARKEVERGDRMQMADYKKYADKVASEQIHFLRPESIKYEDSLTLVTEGVVAANKRLVNFVNRRIRQKRGNKEADKFRPVFHQAIKTAMDNTPEFNLALMPRLWPFVSAEQFSLTPHQPMSDLSASMETKKDIRKFAHRLTETKAMKRTKKFRSWLDEKQLLKPGYLLENTEPSKTSVEDLVKMYESIWWDIGGPLRVIGRLKSAIYWKRIFRK